MTIGTLCSGVGGIDLGFEKAGFECRFVVEIDRNCQNVLRRHFPNALLFSDMTECGAHNLPPVDVLAGGTPCQGFSVAGLRGSLQDDRSNLCLQFVRIANELNPRILVWENVCGCLSTKDNAFGCFLAALVGADAPLVPPRSIDRWRPFTERPDCTDECESDCRAVGHRTITGEAFSWPNAGLVAGPRRTAAWRVVDSQFFGVAQRRERVFVVADTLGGCCSEILFEPEGVRRHSAPSRETGQRTTGTLSARTEGGGGLGTDFELGGDCKPSSVPDVAWALQERDSKGSDSSTKDGHLIPVEIQEPNVTCFQSKDSGESSEDIAPTLRALNHDKSHINGGGQLAVAFKPSHYTRDKDGAPSEVHPPLSADADKGDQEPVIAFKPAFYAEGRVRQSGAPSPVAHPLTASTKEGDHSNVVAYRTSGNCNAVAQGDKTAALNTATDPNQNIVAFQQNQVGEVREGEVIGTLGTNSNASGRNTPMIKSTTMVRRLTPIECARLQAHPDDWCAWGLDANSQRIEQSDSSQYRQYGNGVTVNVLEWIARRCTKHLI